MMKQRWANARKIPSLVVAVATSLVTVSVLGHGAPSADREENRHQKFINTERFAPSKPMSVVHFVKPARFVASSGETVKIHLTVMASEQVDALSIAAKAESGLVLPVSSSQSFGPLKAGAEVTVTFQVTALAEGRRYVNVVATAQSGAGRLMSSYSVPIEVGNIGAAAKSKRSSTVVEDDQGNRLILMPSVKPMNDTQDR